MCMQCTLKWFICFSWDFGHIMFWTLKESHSSLLSFLFWLCMYNKGTGVLGQSECNKNPIEILNSISAHPDNYQQLLNAFYPINQARPSSVIIAYFTNYTDPLPQECEQGTYPWKTTPRIKNTYSYVNWYNMWTTTPNDLLPGRGHEECPMQESIVC